MNEKPETMSWVTWTRNQVLEEVVQMLEETWAQEYHAPSIIDDIRAMKHE